MSLYIVDIHGDIEGDYEIVRKYENEEPFINKPCISRGVCEHDKNAILDKIRAEIEKEIIPRNSDQYDHEAMWQNCGLRMALKAIDKYKAESEDKAN